jgi:hypothetical protein
VNFVKVYFVDGSSKIFTGAVPLSVVTEQFWLRITDAAGNPLANIPREQIKYSDTSLDPQP